MADFPATISAAGAVAADVEATVAVTVAAVVAVSMHYKYRLRDCLLI